jgi:hypothetical protein
MNMYLWFVSWKVAGCFPKCKAISRQAMRLQLHIESAGLDLSMMSWHCIAIRTAARVASGGNMKIFSLSHTPPPFFLARIQVDRTKSGAAVI